MGLWAVCYTVATCFTIYVQFSSVCVNQVIKEDLLFTWQKKMMKLSKVCTYHIWANSFASILPTKGTSVHGHKVNIYWHHHPWTICSEPYTSQLYHADSNVLTNRWIVLGSDLLSIPFVTRDHSAYQVFPLEYSSQDAIVQWFFVFIAYALPPRVSPIYQTILESPADHLHRRWKHDLCDWWFASCSTLRACIRRIVE